MLALNQALQYCIHQGRKPSGQQSPLILTAKGIWKTRPLKPIVQQGN